jgi:hypothetical protein
MSDAMLKIVEETKRLTNDAMPENDRMLNE